MTMVNHHKGKKRGRKGIKGSEATPRDMWGASHTWDGGVRRKLFFENSVWTTTTFVILLLIFAGILLSKFSYVGLVSKQATYVDDISISRSGDSSYTWLIANPGSLSAIKLNGNISFEGDAKVYIENDDETYLIFDSQILKEEERLLDMNFVKNFDEDKSALGSGNINLEYGSGSEYDEDNDGIANTDEIIDFSVASSKFDFEVNYSKLCTIWYVESLDAVSSLKGCYGSIDCCNFLDLGSTGEWNETFYLNYGDLGSTYNNIVSAQVVYFDHSGPKYSSLANLDAKFYRRTIDFDEYCVDTCSVGGFNSDSYKLLVVAKEGSITIDSITYTGFENK